MQLHEKVLTPCDRTNYNPVEEAKFFYFLDLDDSLLVADSDSITRILM